MTLDNVEIIINGQRCSSGEVLTIHTAIESFNPDCGNDSHGKKMALAYLKNINDIRCKMQEV